MKANEIAALLPVVFRETLVNDPTLVTILNVMEAMQDPVEARLTNLAAVFNALNTDDRFAPMLARWVDLVWLYDNDDDYDYDYDAGSATEAWTDSGIAPGRLRTLVQSSHLLAQERGTAAGLVRFLEIATGVHGFTVDDAVVDATPFHLRVVVPKAAADQEALIKRIVDAEKPAYTTWEAVVS